MKIYIFIKCNYISVKTNKNWRSRVCLLYFQHLKKCSAGQQPQDKVQLTRLDLRFHHKDSRHILADYLMSSFMIFVSLCAEFHIFCTIFNFGKFAQCQPRMHSVIMKVTKAFEVYIKY